MKILDLYILKKYLGSFFFVVFALVSIICVIDFAEKNDDYLEAGLTFSQVFMGYYLHVIPYMVNFLSPITVFVSTILLTARLASHTEIIAILSSGVGFIRFMWSYAIGAIALGVLVFYLIGWVIPKSNKERVEFEIEYLNKDSNSNQRNIHLRLTETDYAYLESYDNKRDVGYRFCLESMEDQEVVDKIMSNRIAWDSTKNMWTLSQYKRLKYIDGKEYLSGGISMDTVLNMFPRDFQSSLKRHETLTLPELKAYIADQKIRGLENIRVYEIELNERYTYPVAILILTLMAVIVSARKSREGVGLQIVVGLVLAMIYILFVMTGRSLAQSEALAPAVSAWMPNVIFSVVAVIMYFKVPR